MEPTQTFRLVDGEFSPTEARHVLMSLISSKISFHSMESFGITVRTSGDTSFHENRIKELSQTNSDIKKVTEYAAEKNLRLKINGTLEVILLDGER